LKHSQDENEPAAVPAAASQPLYQDANWVVVNKPTGLSAHAAAPGDLGVVEWWRLYRGQRLHVCSRLDKATSGLMLLARNPAAAKRAQQIHEAGTARKTYVLLSRSDTPAAGRQAWSCDERLDGKAAHTDFERAGRIGCNTLYRAHLHRGRRHQVRRHAAASGIPLLGDDEYGGQPHPRLCLHCAGLQWPEIATTLAAPQPPSFAAAAADSEAARLELDTLLAYERRQDWLSGATDAFRAVHRNELTSLPVAIDVYGAWFNATGFDEDLPIAQLREQLEPCLAAVARQYGCRGGVIRQQRRNPHQRSLAAERLVVGEAPPPFYFVTENDLRYRVSLTETQHVGLFLDQRDTRARLGEIAAGRRVANLFAYTCSFAALAVARGAEVAFSVDLARACLDTGKTNFATNELTDTGRGKFVQADVRKWLARQLRRQREQAPTFRPFDLVICDPPVFAASRAGGKFSVAKEWPRLAADIRQLVASDAVVIFMNNHRAGRERDYRNALTELFPTVIRLRPPLDFPELPGEPTHVRTYWCTS